MSFLTVLGAIFATIISIALSAILGGYTLSTLWGWFVSPLFELPTIGLMQAYGLILIAELARGVPKDDGDKRTFGEKMAEAIFKKTLFCGLILLAGYIAKGFV